MSEFFGGAEDWGYDRRGRLMERNENLFGELNFFEKSEDRQFVKLRDELRVEMAKIREDIESMKLEFNEKLEEIANMIRYMPGGPGFKEAEKDFNEKLAEQTEQQQSTKL